MNLEPYKDPRSVEMAIKEAVKAMHASDPAVSVNERVRQAHFDRLLCRVFSQGEQSEWVLKGGTGMLARIPDTRATKDIDLFATGYTLDQALAALRQLAAVDLGDHFRFEYLGETNGRIAHDREVVRALADVAEQHPAESMRLTTRLIRGDMEGWLASASTKSFSRMISAGVASGGQARAAGVDFANFLGAMGVREFRELV